MSDVPTDRPDIEGPQQTKPPEELPPVEPPSAGFIVQLFVIPGLIVMAVIAVWALFGQISASEQDWRQLVTDLQSTNEHRRGRSATTLAQLLRADLEQGEKGQQLAKNPAIAQGLADVLTEELRDPTASSKADINMQSFLARTLRLLDSTEIVLPALVEAMQPEHDRDVRRNAVVSIAVIAGRLAERGERVDDAATIEAVIEMSAEGDPVLRSSGAYALGLIPGEQSRNQLSVLTGEAFDRNTRVNAAIGLARQQDTGGYDVFCMILSEREPAKEPAAGPSGRDGPSAFEHHLGVKNVLKAVGDLAGRFSSNQSAELTKLVKSVRSESSLTAIRVEAKKTLNRLSEE